jgi:thiol:disulfide interchange protein DsbD
LLPPTRPNPIVNRAISLLLLLLVCGVPAHAQPVRTDNAEAELIAASDAIVPGQPLSVGLRIRHDPHWHTYWQVPGDSGLPTIIRWQLPEGFAAGPIEWPVPRRLPVGPLVNFGYEGELLLPVAIRVPPRLAGSDVTLAARADWLICKDVCIPGGADLKLTLPVREQAGGSRRAALFAATRALVPQPVTLDAARATIDGTRLRFEFKPRAAPRTLEFFPLEEGRIEAAAPQVLSADRGNTALYLTAVQPAAAEFKRLRGVIVFDGGPQRADQGGWTGVIDVALEPGPVAPAGRPAAATAPEEAPAAAPLTLWLALAGAFLGGLILNLMPCVFPVLSLKLLALMQHQRADDAAHRPHASLRAHGLAFAAGVVLSFVALAAFLIVLRAGGEQLGWGFQLQTPWVVATLVLLFFVIGLNLIGAFELNLGSAVVNSAAAQRTQTDRLSGSFGTGALAVLVAAPCTAPFMGAALGYAVTQPAPAALAVFASLGLGMAAPYLLLTLAPGLLARLPRAGAWMLRFKQAMAFPMFATCVWLLWVLAQQVGIDTAALVLGGLVLAGLAAWALGVAQAGARRWRWVAVVAAPVALYAVVGVPLSGPTLAGPAAQAATSDDWEAWSRAAQQSHLERGQPLFVDFTAAWCVTCQANKRLVLRSKSVEAAFARYGVTRLRADWTNRDDEITRELARFKRNGVPLYVVYDGRGKAQILPELLSERVVLEALARAASS